MSYFLIGDVHSQGSPLTGALKYAKEFNLRPIFLGDVFDSRCDTSDSVYVYNRIRVAEKEQDAVTLNSNHQVRLRNYLNDGIGGSEATETIRTLTELRESGANMEEVKKWLRSCPSGFAFRDHTGRLYGCAHAYFPQKWINQINGDPMTFYTNNEEEEHAVVWGPHTPSSRRIKWWNKNIGKSWTRCAGHYHKVVVNDSSIVLDGNAGFPNGRIAAFNVSNQKVVYFD